LSLIPTSPEITAENNGGNISEFRNEIFDYGTGVEFGAVVGE
jgi:hypothetical protein